MQTILVPGLITVGSWIVLFFILRFLSRYILIVKKLRVQISISIIIGGLFYLIQFVNFSEKLYPEWAADRAFLTNKGLPALLAIMIIWAALKYLGVLFFRHVLKDREEVIIPPLIRKFIMAVIYLIAIFLVLRIAGISENLTGLLVGSTVFAALVGLAFQDTLINFISGVALSVEKPFRLNDWVRVGGEEGVVTEISWRSTKVRTRDNNMLIIPNSIIAKEMIINYDHPSKLQRQTLRLGVAYGTSPRLVRQALLEAARQVEPVLDNPPPDVHLVDYDDFSINYELRYWLADYELVPDIASQIRAEIYDVFRKRGVKIPYPIRDIYLYRGTGAGVEGGRPHLIVVEGGEAGTLIELAREEVTLGRGTENSFSIKDPMVSKKHARIVPGEEGYVLEDLQSKSGTIVNGVRVQRWRLREGDEIKIGSARFLFEKRRF